MGRTPIDSEAEMDESGHNAWRHPVLAPSLPEVFRSVKVPTLGSWKRLLAFAGPGYLIAVGYMDPGNWATDIGGGSAYGYALLSVVLISNFLAIFLQALSSKLGIVAGRDLAQACRDAYHPWVGVSLWISAEIGIVACDLAEVIGAAIALQLLFGIPLVVGVVLTGLDVLLVLALQGRGFRWIEALVIGLIGAMIVIFGLEIAYSRPDWVEAARGLVPTVKIVKDPAMLYISLGILGATVMPHNLYLHSSIVQTRAFGSSEPEVRSALKMAWIDSAAALTIAFFVNAAILIVAAATFFRRGHHDVAEIKDAYAMLTPLLGVGLATPLFAVALLASGQNSTLTGTLAGQVVLEGFTRFRMTPWLRRLVSRVGAIVPAVVAAAVYGSSGTAKLLIFSQVILSAQLCFAVVPLVQFTSDPRKMGRFVNSRLTMVTGWAVAVLIAGLNAYLIATIVLDRQPSPPQAVSAPAPSQS